MNIFERVKSFFGGDEPDDLMRDPRRDPRHADIDAYLHIWDVNADEGAHTVVQIPVKEVPDSADFAHFGIHGKKLRPDFNLYSSAIKGARDDLTSGGHKQDIHRITLKSGRVLEVSPQADSARSQGCGSNLSL